MIKQMITAIKKIKNWQMYVVAILVTLLICVVWPMVSEEAGTEGSWPGFSELAATQKPAGDDGLETRMEKTLSAIKGVGSVSVVIAYEEEAVAAFAGAQTTAQKPRGAVVVAEGAANIGVKMELCRAVHALLGIDMASIEVFEMNVDGMPLP